MKIRCLAVDDEILALDLLGDNIAKVPFLELVKSCGSAMEALDILRTGDIDLLFLDIQMPDISGIQLLRSLPQKPLVIMTTAFSNYATEGFDLDVIDYLLKPYSFERFMKAVNKAYEYLDLRERASAQPGTKKVMAAPGYLFVKADYRLYKIDLDDILYVEGLKDYVKIVTPGKPILSQISMKALEEKLPAGEFIRVHRSYIIAFRKIGSIQKHQVTIAGKDIPVGEGYRDELFKRIRE